MHVISGISRSNRGCNLHPLRQQFLSHAPGWETIQPSDIEVDKPDRIAHVHGITFFDCYACKGSVPQNTWGAHLLWKCHIEGKKKQREKNTTWKYKRLIGNTNFAKWWILILWWTNHDKIDIRNLFYQGLIFLADTLGYGLIISPSIGREEEWWSW